MKRLIFVLIAAYTVLCFTYAIPRGRMVGFPKNEGEGF